MGPQVENNFIYSQPPQKTLHQDDFGRDVVFHRVR